jgi:hypothetical protein
MWGYMWGQSSQSPQFTYATLAEEVGFEPTESLHPRWFSRPVP